MDNKKIASQLLFMAREVLGMDFPTQDAFDKYMKDHPDANRSNHKVVKTKRSPAKKSPDKSREKLEREIGDDISTHLRDSLLNTKKVVTEDDMFMDYNKTLTSRGHMGVSRNIFKKVGDEEVESGGLEKVDGGYKWSF